MKYIKKFESHTSKGNNDVLKYQHLKEAKDALISKIGHDPIEFWHELDDRLTQIKDKWGEFLDKYGRNRPVIDFDDIDIAIDIKEDSYYKLAHIRDHKWNRDGSRVELDESILEYSIYASNFDDKFLKFYEKHKNTKPDILNPFYSILIAFDSYYFDDNRDKSQELTNELSSELESVFKKLPYNIEFYNIEYFNYETGEWTKINSLKDLKYPRVIISFFAD